MQSQFLPENFVLKDIDNTLFDRTMFSDAAIVEHCIDYGLMAGYCEFVDFNGDGRLTSADSDLFYATVEQYDFNGDGILNGVSISF
jgi:hypothetical protein